MRRNFANGVAVLALLVALGGYIQGAAALAAQKVASIAPTRVSYQGRVTLDGALYTGKGYFKFAILDPAGADFLWSNDGSTGPDAPAGYVQLAVEDGLFNILLGEESLGMPPLDASAFAGPERVLRVWFSPDGVDFLLLEPDRAIASVPFALVADVAGRASEAESAAYAVSAGNAGLLDGQDSTAFQQRVDGFCPGGYAIDSVGVDGSVSCKPVQPLPTFLRRNFDDRGADTGRYTAVVVGVDGLPLITYYDDTNHWLMVAHCNDLACASATSRSLATMSNDPYNSMVVGADGLALIAYYKIGNLELAHCSDLLCSDATIVPVDYSTNDEGKHPSITIGADGLPLISYNKGAALRVAHCNDLTCSDFDVYDPADPYHPSDQYGLNTAIITGANGLGIVAYKVSKQFDEWEWRVGFCQNVACSAFSGEPLVLAAASGVTSSDFALIVGPGGQPVMIYAGRISIDPPEYGLYISTCSSVGPAGQCYGSAHSLVQQVASLDVPLSVIIGSDGLPLISYYDPADQDLELAHCNDLTCQIPVITTLDSAGDVGQYNAITLGSDGLGFITYYDAENQDLKTIHLSNRIGTPYARWR